MTSVNFGPETASGQVAELFSQQIQGKTILTTGVSAGGLGARFSYIIAAHHPRLLISAGKTYSKRRAYGQSKSANMLFTVSLSEKLAKKGVLSFSLHPGVILTNLGRAIEGGDDWKYLKALQREMGLKQGWEEEFTFKPPSQGVATHVVAAFDPSIASHSGEYLLDGRLAPNEEVKEYAVDKGNAASLWELSEKIVGEKFGC